MASFRKRIWLTATGNDRAAWAVDFTDANGKRHRRQFATQAEAKHFRTEIEGKLRAGTFRPEAAKMTVKDACDLYLVYCEGRMRRNEHMTKLNFKSYEGHLRNYVSPDPNRFEEGKRPRQLTPFDGGIGAIKLAKLTALEVEDFRDELREAGLSVPTTRKVLKTLYLALAYAISRNLLAVNVAKGVKVIGRRDEDSKKIVAPPKEAVRRLIQVADDDLRVILVVASASGARAGELWAMRWRHINFAAAEITIETRVDRYGEEDVTKTKAGMRTVPLGAEVVQTLKRWKIRSKHSKDDDLVFPGLSDGYMCHSDFSKRRFLPLFKELAALHEADPDNHPAAPKRFNWHALRHFAISTWIAADLRPKTVQTFAGHSSLQYTMDRYGHLFKSDDHKAAMDSIAKEMFGNGTLSGDPTGGDSGCWKSPAEMPR